MSRKVKIRVKKDTILSKKFVKKIKSNIEDEISKKKKKKKNKSEKPKFKKPKKDKNKWKESNKNKSPKKSSNVLIVGETNKSSGVSEIAKRLMKLLKKDMEIKVEMSKLISKLLK